VSGVRPHYSASPEILRQSCRGTLVPIPRSRARDSTPPMQYPPLSLPLSSSPSPAVTSIPHSQTRGYSFAVVYRIMQQTTGPPVINRVQRHSEYRQLSPSTASLSLSLSLSCARALALRVLQTSSRATSMMVIGSGLSAAADRPGKSQSPRKLSRGTRAIDLIVKRQPAERNLTNSRAK